MLLDKNFSREFISGRSELRIGFIRPEARHKISAGIALMSRETIRHRFFGIKNGFTDRELKYLTEIDGINHFALGVEEVRTPERGVAVMRLVRDDLSVHEAEVAILIVDEFQKRGLGTILMNFCLLAAYERDIHFLRFTYLPDNEAIVKLIRRFGASAPERIGSDYVQMKIPVTETHAIKARQALAQFFN